MARCVQHMIAVKHAMQRLLADDPGFVSVASVLAPGGPEVHVIVKAGHEKRLRVRLPADRLGVPVIVRVEG